MLYEQYFIHRTNTFKKAFDLLLEYHKNKPINIVELGTTRSFLSGVLCNDPNYFNVNEPDNWDWGAGIFTKVFSDNLNVGSFDYKLYTIDPSIDAINVSKHICCDNDNIIYINDYSTNFLQNIDFKIDFLYMDHMESSEEACVQHLIDAKIVVEKDLLSENGIVLIDDVNYPDYINSKGKYSIPYFLENNFYLVIGEYQVILVKS
jgi:hypothetical protein